MTARSRTVLLGAAVLALGAAAVAATSLSAGERSAAASVATAADSFPHAEHAGLFPLCTGCHSGVLSGDTAALYPEPRSCATCHDGEQADRVEWSGPRREPSGLVFDHPEHAAEMRREGEEEVSCESCHTPSGETRMAVRGRAVPDRCISCHAHEAERHYADAQCETCHTPLAESGFSRARVAALPEPDGHDEAGFLPEAHGEAAEADGAACQTCHTRERCTSCHVEGAEREAVAAIPGAPAGMELPRLAARYPTPESHESEAWFEAHGDRVRPGECSTCHTRQSCTTCHRDAPPRSVAQLPDGGRTAAPGVSVTRRAPSSHEAPWFPTEHGDLAAADPDGCTSCHSESSCTDCHAGGGGGASSLREPRSPGSGFSAVHSGGESGPAPGAEPNGNPGSNPVGPARAGSFPSGRDTTTEGDTATADTTTADTTTADTVSAGPAAAPWPGSGLRSESGGFHPANFLARHSAAAYGNRMECANCHSTGAFCRDCHQQVGMGSSGRVGPGFHDGQPLWLLRHGQAARQALESCASCHRQTDCIQCHSTTGAFSVNPHGPNFDAGRYADRNRQVCLACHLSDPLGGGAGR